MIYPDDFMNKIICGDCLEVMKYIPDNSIDLIITSPPYDKIRTYNEYELDLSTLGNSIYRVLSDGGVCAVVIQDSTKNFAKSLTSFRLAIDWCDNTGFKLFETIIYHRHGRPGAWWSKRFRVDHEYILLFLKGGRPKYFDKKSLMVSSIHAGEIFHGTQRLTNGTTIPIKPTKQADLKCRGTVWFYKTSNTEASKLKMKHPATFPDLLAKDLITCFTKENGIVLDPLVGSGTSCVTAKKMNRNYIGIDISEEYVNLANQRLAEI